MSAKTLMTVEQFAQMQAADTENYELVDGGLIPLSSGTPLHAKIRDLIGHLLWIYFKSNPIGESFGEIDLPRFTKYCPLSRPFYFCR
jgi:Uma2 family endonuclease